MSIEMKNSVRKLYTINTIHNQIYKKLIKLVPKLWLLEVGDALKNRCEPYMDLSLDVLCNHEDFLIIALAHYKKHPSGDLIADPDMQIRVFRDDHGAEALTYQDFFGYQAVYVDKNRFYPHRKRSLNTFLNEWLKNCLRQGHSLQAGERVA